MCNMNLNVERCESVPVTDCDSPGCTGLESRNDRDRDYSRQCASVRRCCPKTFAPAAHVLFGDSVGVTALSRLGYAMKTATNVFLLCLFLGEIHMRGFW